ncbi:hypothetical protein DFAR_1890008 [Desulfarculales bacterium]
MRDIQGCQFLQRGDDASAVVAEPSAPITAAHVGVPEEEPALARLEKAQVVLAVAEGKRFWPWPGVYKTSKR